MMMFLLVREKDSVTCLNHAEDQVVGFGMHGKFKA